MLAKAEAAGATVLRSARAASWGGHSGYFADPDGFPWEVAWNPASRSPPIRAFVSPIDQGGYDISFENADRAERGVQLRNRVRLGQDGHAFVAFELIQQRGLALTAGDQDRQPRVNPAQPPDQGVSGRVGKPDVDDGGGEFAFQQSQLALGGRGGPRDFRLE